MSNFLELLDGPVGRQAIDLMSNSLGVQRDQTANAVTSAIPILLSALTRNASQPNGAEELNNALAKNHDGSILDNLPSLLGQASHKDGSGILGHILGGQRGRVEEAIGHSAGIDQKKSASLLEMLAPLLMGALGKQKQQSGLGANDLSDLLNGLEGQVKQQEPKQSSLIAKLLDRDGDGQFMDDLTSVGMNVLSSLLRR